MQAILKSKHHGFLNWLEEVQIKKPELVGKLTELQLELQFLYDEYQIKIREIKLLVQKYEKQQKAIYNEVKRRSKESLLENKN